MLLGTSNMIAPSVGAVKGAILIKGSPTVLWLRNTPQNNLVFWGLLETIYGDSASGGDSSSKGLDSRDEPDFISDKITIGEAGFGTHMCHHRQLYSKL